MSDESRVNAIEFAQEIIAAREHLRVTARFLILLFAASAYLALAFSLLSAASLDALPQVLSLPLLIVTAVAVVALALVLRAYGDARHEITTRSTQARLDREHARYIELSASRVSNATQQVQQVQVDDSQRSAYKTLSVNGRSISDYDVINKFPTRSDLDHFVDQVNFAESSGFALRSWLGRTMPSGKVIADIADWHALLQVFVEIKAIAALEEAKRVRVLIQDAARVRLLLDERAQAEAKQKQQSSEAAST